MIHILRNQSHDKGAKPPFNPLYIATISHQSHDIRISHTTSASVTRHPHQSHDICISHTTSASVTRHPHQSHDICISHTTSQSTLQCTPSSHDMQHILSFSNTSSERNSQIIHHLVPFFKHFNNHPSRSVTRRHNTMHLLSRLRDQSITTFRTILLYTIQIHTA
jgi:hypothetical protein